MSERVSLIFDDGSKTDFNNLDELLFHVDRQGLSGVVKVVENVESDEPVESAGDDPEGASKLVPDYDSVVLTREDLNSRTPEETDAHAEKVLAAAPDVEPASDYNDEAGEA